MNPLLEQLFHTREVIPATCGSMPVESVLANGNETPIGPACSTLFLPLLLSEARNSNPTIWDTYLKLLTSNFGKDDMGIAVTLTSLW